MKVIITSSYCRNKESNDNEYNGNDSVCQKYFQYEPEKTCIQDIAVKKVCIQTINEKKSDEM